MLCRRATYGWNIWILPFQALDGGNVCKAILRILDLSIMKTLKHKTLDLGVQNNIPVI